MVVVVSCIQTPHDFHLFLKLFFYLETKRRQLSVCIKERKKYTHILHHKSATTESKEFIIITIMIIKYNMEFDRFKLVQFLMRDYYYHLYAFMPLFCVVHTCMMSFEWPLCVYMRKLLCFIFICHSFVLKNLVRSDFRMS